MEKILYLTTAYHGRPGDVLKFGRECGTNTTCAPSISLVLPQAHEAVADGEDYWKSPQIWHEIQQCFERYFARKDQDPGYRHNYARFAYLCEQWDVLADQINQMGPEVNYSYFGGKNAYLGMVKKAQAMSQRKIVAPGTP